MFLHSTDVLSLSEACLQSFYASLNAPVVHVEQLPVASARAAIVIYAEEYGDLGLAIGLRSLENGKVALYRYRGCIQGDSQIPAAVDDAIIFAEGLGFLFDDNMIEGDGAQGRRQALEHWNQLMGEGEVWTAAAVAAPPTPELSTDLEPPDGELAPAMEDLLPLDEDELTLSDEQQVLVAGAEPVDTAVEGAEDELLLDDLMEIAEEPDLELVAEPPAASTGETPGGAGERARVSVPSPPVADVVPGGVPLTKFRRPVDGAGTASAEAAQSPESRPPATNAEAGSGSELGRIPIVRLRAGSDAPKPGVLTRLLSSF